MESNNAVHIVAALLIAGIAILLSQSMVAGNADWAIIGGFGAMCAIIALISPSTGLYLIIVAMMFSPEIPFMDIIPGGGRRAVVRFDDLIIVFVTISWLLSKIIRREGKHLHRTPLDLPIVFFIFTCALSTARGVLINQVYPMKGFFYVLKLTEYILIYYMVVNNTHSTVQVRNFIKLFFFVAFAVSLYGYLQLGDGAVRVSAPFEGEAEPNTYGGYFVFMFCMIFAFVIAPVRGFNRFAHFLLLLIIIPPYLYTLSRGSYLAFFPAIIAMFWFAPAGKKKLPIVLLLASVLAIPLLPATVKKRVEYTFSGRTTYNLPAFGGETNQVRLDKSSVARLQTWDTVMGYWMQYPILGLGITGAGFIDSQWMRTIGELGLLGIIAAIWLFRSFIANVLRLYRVHYDREDDLGFTLGLGYLGGLVGLMIHAVTANTFYIVRIMGPFWFFTGLIVMLQKFEADKVPAEETGTTALPPLQPEWRA